MLWRLVLVCAISIIGASGETKEAFGNERDGVSLSCPVKKYIFVHAFTFSVNDPTKLGKDQKAQYDRLLTTEEKNKYTQKIIDLCQYHVTTVCHVRDIKSGINLKRKEKILIRVKYECKDAGCPHPGFLAKHVSRAFDGKIETMNEVATYRENKIRYRLSYQPTNKMMLFSDKPSIGYGLANGRCRFTAPAQGFDCVKTGSEWKCKELAQPVIAEHDPVTGHYLGFVNGAHTGA